MGIFSAALGMSCEDCHAAGDADWAVYAKDSPRKQMARVMVTMMATINKTHFGGRQVVTCYSCHRGSARPRATADLAELYGTPPGADPNGVFEQAPNAPPAEEVLDKYIQAIGGAQRADGAHELRRQRHQRRLWTRERAAPRRDLCATRAAHDDHPHVGGRQHHDLRRQCGLDRGAVQAGRGAGLERPGHRRPEARCRPGVSRQHPTGPDEVASRAAHGHRRPRGAGRPGNDRARRDRDALLRHGVRPCSCDRSATSIRRSGGFRRRPTTRTIATWPA